MLLDSELESPILRQAATQRLANGTTRIPIWTAWGIGCRFFALVVLFQIVSGAYRSEFSAYPDEPAHYVTSLMLRDYVTHFHFESPVRFAQEYYRHYPKVALGHWPPFFYIVQALWMLLFSASRVSIRVEVAVTTALLAYSVYSEGRRWFGPRLAVAGGFLTICLPLVQTYSAEEMSEVLLTLLCFWSAAFFGRYMASERSRDSVLFGVFFSLSVLTKGNGWLLAMIPPIAIVLTRRWRLLTQRSLWFPVAIVAVVCLPWQILTMNMAQRGWEGGSRPTLSYTAHALTEFLQLFPQIVGPALLALMALGIFVTVLKPMFRGSVLPGPAVMLGLLAAVWVFHSVIPAGVEDRKLIIAVPAMILFALSGALWIANLVPHGSPVFRWRVEATLGILALSFFAQTFQIPRVQHFGYNEAAGFLTANPEFRNAVVLVSSQSGGEGMLISEVAMAEPHPSETILRGTKSLASVDWNGASYHCAFSNPSAVMQFLKQKKVNLVVVDTFTPQTRFQHDSLLKRTIQESPAFRLVKTFRPKDPVPPGEIRIYKLAS